MTDMDIMKQYREEAEKARDIERKYLLSFDDIQAANQLSTQDQYQRLRYQREIFADEWLRSLRKKYGINDVTYAKTYIEYRTD